MSTTKHVRFKRPVLVLGFLSLGLIAGCNDQVVSSSDGGLVAVKSAVCVSEDFDGGRALLQSLDRTVHRDQYGAIVGVNLRERNIDYDTIQVSIEGRKKPFLYWDDTNDVDLIDAEDDEAVISVEYCREAKVAICHIPPGNPGEAHTINVGSMAVRAHMAHGDTMGSCLGEEPTPEPSPTPTPEVTPTPEPTPEVSPSPEPSPEPTPEPTVSPEPTPTPEPTPEVTPTPEPTPEVTPTPEPTPEVTPSPEPTPEVTPTPEPSPVASFPINGFDAAAGSTAAYLIWYTPGVPSTSQVIWGETPQLGNVSSVNTALVEDHAVTIGGLLPNRTYYFQAVSTDAQGRVSYSQVISKTTKP